VGGDLTATPSWKYDVEAVSAFVTRDNIDGLISGAGIRGDVGLLSIDIDGNDYWILDAIEVVSPRILIVEYNSNFGPDVAVTIPYDEGFCRTVPRFHNVYYGASLGALCDLADRRGYAFVGSNSAGVNAFFVRRDVLGGLPSLKAQEGYVVSRVRESRGLDGALTYVRRVEDRLRLIADLPLYETRSGRTLKIGDLFRLGDSPQP
jgi:hypothetical protein